MVYLNDIIIFSRIFEVYMKDLNEAFIALQSAGLTLKDKKYHLACSQVKYLRYIISKNGMMPNLEKIEAIKVKKALEDI